MGIHILVVDDNAYDRELTARALRGLAAPPGPAETTGVADWRAAEPYVAAGRCDVVLLDYHLPDATGLDVVRALHGRPHPPIIVMTGQNDVAIAVETLRAGAADYVPKSEDWASALCLAVERVLERVRLEQELARSRAQLRANAADLEAKVASRTAIVRAQAAEIEALYLRVEEAARLKAEIVANVSHELRTPLNAIFGYTELLGEYVDGDPAEMLRCVRVQAERLHRLVESLLALGRLRTGREDVEPSRFSLTELVDDLRAQAEVLNADRGLALEWSLPPAPCLLMHDREKLRVIAYHLVNNAIKFTPVGRVEITFEAAESGAIRLTVSDTGIGFPDDARAIVFEDFRQLDGSLTRRYEGTGLGLGIVRRCTELLGGTVRLESAPHYGTTIVVELPALEDDAGVEAAARPSGTVK